MTSSFQPQTRPVDTFVRQSRVAAVNTQDGFGQLASALSIINPSLRKMLESEIDKQRGIIGAEAEQAAKEIYDPTSPNYVNLYNDAVDQQFPENAELENTEEEWGNTLQNVEKTRGSTEAQILAGRSPWFKHNFNKRKATLLGQTFADNLQNRFYTDTALDDKGVERPISSFPTNSIQFQNWQSKNRSPYIEKLDVEPYYFNKFFVPELDKGHDKVQELSRAEYPQQLFESYKQVSVNKINTAINKYKKLKGLQGEALANAEKDLRDDLANDNKQIRKLFKGKNFNSLLKIQINTIKENALEIAFSGEEGAVDKARTLLNDFGKYFPTNDSGTSVLKDHPEFLKIKNDFNKDMLELEDDILDNTEELNKKKLENQAYGLLSDPNTTAEDVEEFFKENPSSEIASFMNETVVLARPETYNRLDEIRMNALTEGFYATKGEALQELRSWYKSTLQLPSQTKAFETARDHINENFSGELSGLTKGQNYINLQVAAEFKTADGLDFQKARDGINMRDIQKETRKKLNTYYENYKAEKGTPPAESEIRDEAERLAELAVEEARAYIYGQGGVTQKDVDEARNTGKLQLLIRIVERTRDQKTKELPTVETVTQQYQEYEPDITPEGVIQIFESLGRDPSSIMRNVEKYIDVEETSKQEFSDLRGGDSEVDGFGNPKVDFTDKNKSSNKDTPARPDEVLNPLNLSKVFSDIVVPPANAAKDGTLLATGDVPPPIGAGENFMNRFNMYLQTTYGFDTDSSIYKNMPNYMKTNLMGSFQDDEAAEIAEKETDQPTTTTGEFLPSQDLSEVQSDITPNLGLRDGSLLAMALPFKGKENKKQEDTKVTISKENNAVQRMETNFKTIYKLAKEVGVKFPEVVAAQFGVESDHGLQVTGKNNYFGIKATQAEIDAGQSTLAPTFEEVDGKKVRVMAHFKNFDTVKQSIEHYKKFWNDDFQDRKGTVNVDTAEEAIIRLKENGYATDSDYVKLVTDVLNDARREPKLF